MPTADSTEFQIKVIQKENIKGPLPKISGTASLANRASFFFNLPQPNQSNPITVQPPHQKG